MGGLVSTSSPYFSLPSFAAFSLYRYAHPFLLLFFALVPFVSVALHLLFRFTPIPIVAA
jgi:hypothetical protein